TFPVGATTVTCRATDAHHNTGTGTFKITVKDSTAPTVTPPADRTAEGTGQSGLEVGSPAATATDTVEGSLAAPCTPASGSTFALGQTTVTCTATDAHG